LGCKDISYSIPRKVTINGAVQTVTDVAAYAFAFCDLNKLTIADTIVNMYNCACAHSTIDNLEYMSTNCSSDGFVELVDDTYQIAPIFYVANIGTINFAGSVQQVPMYMFYGSTFKSVVINSYSTVFEEKSFRDSQAYMYELIFNFDDVVDNSYLTMIKNSNNRIAYAKFISLKKSNNNNPWCEFINSYDEDEYKYQVFLQFVAHKQWFNLKKYANDNNIEIIGDLPIYVNYK
jgi:hypothetical protein